MEFIHSWFPRWDSTCPPACRACDRRPSIQSNSSIVSSPLNTTHSSVMQLYASTCLYAPVDDVSCLYKDVHFTGPISVRVDHARHFKNLLSISNVSVQVPDRNDSGRSRYADIRYNLEWKDMLLGVLATAKG